MEEGGVNLEGVLCRVGFGGRSDQLQGQSHDVSLKAVTELPQVSKPRSAVTVLTIRCIPCEVMLEISLLSMLLSITMKVTGGPGWAIPLLS